MDERLRKVGFETRDFARCRDAGAVVERALSLLAAILETSSGCAFAVEDTRLTRVAQIGADRALAVVPLPAPPDSPLTALLERGETIHVADAASGGDALPSAWRGDAAGPLLAVACRDSSGRTRAVLRFSGRLARPFDCDELEIARMVAGHAGEALLTIEIVNQLRDAEQSMRQLVERSLAGICLIQDERTLYANPRMAEMLGLPPGEAGALFGRAVREFIHPDDHPWLRIATRRRTAGSSVPERDEIRLLRADGSVAWAEVLVTLVPHDERPALLVHAVDISARKHAEAEREQFEARFLQAQKMEAIGRLAGGVAHDFNNLLMAISGHTELLARRTPQEHHRHLDHIRKATEQAAGLTRQLLAFSRKQELQIELVSLNDVVTATHKLLRRIIGEDVALQLQLDPATFPVRADPALVGQVLMNLAVNARDAMPQGGTLTIETSNVELTPSAATAELPAGPYARLSVVDTGVGMSEEVLDRLFEPFFSTKEHGKGTGLGLAMVYGTVQQTGGHIGVESEVGKGTAFRLYFPRAVRESPAVPAPAPEPPRHAARGSETILAVEDEAEVRDLVASMLEGLGYRVLAAPDASAALLAAREHGGPIDLLLTDVVLPGMSGPALGHILTGQRPELRVLYVSGYLEGSGPGHGLPEDSVLLHKPFSLEDLASTVRRVLDGGRP
jgi:two-component system, cell cycle sensor histidine kinase and response regulator CckA